jgi:hypothetical protein
MKAFLTAVFLAVAASSANAGTVWYQGSVQLVYPLNDGSFLIGVPAVLPVYLGSGSGTYLYVTPGANAVTLDGAKNMLSTVLTAFALGRNIEVAYDDASSSCYVNRLLIQ